MGGDNSSLETLTLNDLPAGKLVIRHAVLTLQNWNAALPQLNLQDVDLDVRARRRRISRSSFSAQLPPVLGGA